MANVPSEALLSALHPGSIAEAAKLAALRSVFVQRCSAKRSELLTAESGRLSRDGFNLLMRDCHAVPALLRRQEVDVLFAKAVRRSGGGGKLGFVGFVQLLGAVGCRLRRDPCDTAEEPARRLPKQSILVKSISPPTNHEI